MATSMMKSLLRFHDRIRRMYLALDRPDMMEFCELLPVDSSFPQLASLKIQDRPDPLFWRLELIERVPDIGTLLSRMPLLRSFEIGPLTGQSDLQYRALPCRWEILTNISIQDFLTPTDLLGILAQSRALKTVESSLSISGPSFPSESSFPTAVLVNLTTLRLKISLNLYHGPFGIGREETERRHSQCLVHISAIISRIICSSLKSLHVSIYSARPAIASSQLPIRSLPLHELEILGLEMPMTPQAFTECLELVPNLISFDFVNAGDTLEDFHLVTLTPSSNNPLPLCPQLRHFRMMDRRTDAGSSHHWSIQNLTEFIAGRHKDKMLDSCDLFFPESPSFTEEQIQLLRKLKEDGLKLRVHHYRASQPEIITGYIDEPTSGLINHGHGPTSLSDMNDTFDTEIIV
ncbi:hypothetical protein GYMLUDRAFT_58600 [Collybiopsis luxurians FD-317 M1]|uniref:F-box domain-containing protein n=1 Tax=Collybiopsis luxurians FD-317 M1 TaxID=944289 RepID=A0A0D0CZP6_9AGAR|nr:hypothetical protein GYMLUDRAFT_58600 [Collybiopsis luxurians FD-317 M1]